MVMTVYGQEIPCARAEKGADFVRAYDEGGACVFEAAKIADFSGYSLTGGAWSAAEPTDGERIGELEALESVLADYPRLTAAEKDTVREHIRQS